MSKKNIFQYYSDIYYNLNVDKGYISITPIIEKDAINHLILAGNIGKITSNLYWNFIKRVASKFNHVYLIAGDVELEGLSQSYIASFIKSNLNSLKIQNVHFLDNSAIYVNGCKIIGGYKFNQIIENELSETRVPCILITNHKPYSISSATYCVYGNTLKNIDEDKLITNQYGKNWFQPLFNFKHNAHFIIPN
jgi:hypothetical protein